MNKLTRIYIVRHGESEGNVKERLGESFEPTEHGPSLTEKGKLQAAALAKKLRIVHFDVAFSSDFLRAKETAEILTLERDIAATTTQAIRERHGGSYEGKWHEIKHLLREKIEKLANLEEKLNYTYKDIENEGSAANRLLTFVREVAVAYSGKTVLIVCHGNLMRSFLIKIGFAQYEELGIGTLENTGYFVLESDGIDFFVKETHGIHKQTIKRL